MRYTTMKDSRYWFPAKRYGWGWGFPTTWQGWVVLIGYFVFLAVGAWVLPPNVYPQYFSVWVAAMSGLLLGVCKLKGEPPTWRWGK